MEGLKAIDGGVGGPAFTFTFNTTDEVWYNVFPLDSMDELGATKFKIWASYDGTTNAPTLYPIGAEVRDVEAMVLRGRSSDPWGVPPLSAVATNATPTGLGNVP